MNAEKEHKENALRDLLKSDALTPPTRRALEARTQKAQRRPAFFKDDHFNLLSGVCDLLLAQDPQSRLVNVALFIDERLHDKACDGWRYADMPPDDQMYLKGLDGIEETALLLYEQAFLRLATEKQLHILELIQHSNAPGEQWKEFSAGRFFEELLAEVTEIFVSYPTVQIEMNYKGMADAFGWQNIGLNSDGAINDLPDDK